MKKLFLLTISLIVFNSAFSKIHCYNNRGREDCYVTNACDINVCGKGEYTNCRCYERVQPPKDIILFWETLDISKINFVLNNFSKIEKFLESVLVDNQLAKVVIKGDEIFINVYDHDKLVKNGNREEAYLKTVKFI